MKITDSLKFVKGAVSTKSVVPEMKHFVIEDGFVRAFNGTIALCSPIAFDMNCAPTATAFYNAINNCGDVVSLSMTGTGRLKIASGGFKAFIECVDMEGLPHQTPEGEIIDIDGEGLLSAIEALTPFVGTDASREWANGILFNGQSAYATNNVCLVQYWLGAHFPHIVNVPMPALKEVVRIGKPPVALQIAKESITFRYEDGSWVWSRLYDVNWDERFAALLDAPAEYHPVPDGLFAALTDIKPFVETNQRVYFSDNQVSTSLEEEEGATFEVQGVYPEGIYNVNMLLLLKDCAKFADFSNYPKPVPFKGGALRGIIAGQN